MLCVCSHLGFYRNPIKRTFFFSSIRGGAVLSLYRSSYWFRNVWGVGSPHLLSKLTAQTLELCPGPYPWVLSGAGCPS